MTTAPCGTCQGTGQEIPDPCGTCGGAGRVSTRAEVTLDIPAGVSDGMELRVQGSGHAGIAGGPPGDLYVQLQVDPPSRSSAGTRSPFGPDITITQATLGADITVPGSTAT
jgi:molecular chaperone DnaJ